MGVNQSHQGVRTAQAIINLALMTGNIGRPGTGANSITGQCNAMGSRLFSNTTNLLGGHAFDNPDHRHKVARTLGIDERLIPREKSWPYHRIIEGILSGQIRGLWVVVHESRAFLDQSVDAARRARSTRLPRRAGHVSQHRDGATGGSRSARRRLGRERRARSSIRNGGSACTRRWPARRALPSPTSRSSN